MRWLAESGLDGAALALALTLAALGAGGAALRDRNPSLRALIEQTAVGFALLAWSALVLGALGALQRQSLIAPGALALLGARQLWRSRQALRSAAPQSPFEWLAAAVLAVLLGTGLLAALGPELAPDALSYHLPAAAGFVSPGDPFDPRNYPTGYPLLGEAVYAWPAAAGRPEGARVVHFLATILATAATALLARRAADRTAGWLAAALLAGMPMVVWMGQTANTDAFAMLCLALAALRLDDHLRSGQARDLGACGLLLGLCASAKIWNLLFIPLFAAAVLAFWLRLARQSRRAEPPRRQGEDAAEIGIVQTRGHDPISLSSSGERPPAAEIGIVSPGLRAASLALWALLAYAPWAARAYALTGDPLYPLLQIRLGDGATRAFYQFVATQVRDNYGVGRGVVDLLLAGWNLTFRPERFGDLPVGWLLLPLTTFGLARVRRYPLLYLLLPLAAVALAVWFATSQQVRYLAPLAPLAAALGAVPVAAAAQQRRSRWLAPLVALLALTGWGPLAAASWPAAGFRPHVPWDLLAGRASRDAVRERCAYNDEWALWRFANAALPDNAAFLGDGAAARWWAFGSFADISYDPAAWSAFSAWLKRPGELDSTATHLITTPARAKQLGNRLDAAFCRVYTNGSLEVWQRRQPNDVCAVPPLAAVEPYRWVEVASPHDPQGYWWIGARAKLLLPRGAALEIVAPFAAAGVHSLDVSIDGAAPVRYEIAGRRTLAFADAAAVTLDLTAPQTINPLELGFAGDPTPKAFLGRLAESPRP